MRCQCGETLSGDKTDARHQQQRLLTGLKRIATQAESTDGNTVSHD